MLSLLNPKPAFRALVKLIANATVIDISNAIKNMPWNKKSETCCAITPTDEGAKSIS